MFARIFILVLFYTTFSRAQVPSTLFNSEEICDTSSVNQISVVNYFASNCCSISPSVSKGTPSSGSLKNGVLIPYIGENYFYFDSLSYKCGRAYVHSNVRDLLIAAFDSLYTLMPGRYFGIMECSAKNGGELKPHKTHQNGLSVDLMVPKIKDGKPYLGLDTLGIDHYLLDFDKSGRYSEDESVSIDFETMAREILVIKTLATQYKLTIEKIIFQIALKDDLFAGKNGQKLKDSGIYFAQNLPFLIDILHDDHFHIDFKIQD